MTVENILEKIQDVERVININSGIKEQSIIETITDIKNAFNEVKKILNTIGDLVSENANLGNLKSIEYFEAFDYNKYDNPNDLKELQSNLKMVSTEIQTWVNNNKGVVKAEFLMKKNKKNHKLRKCFIFVLFMFMVAAVVFTILEKTEIFIISSKFSIGEIIGLVDMCIGIIAFIYELYDDSKMKSTCELLDEMNEKNVGENLKKIIMRNQKITSLFNFGVINQTYEESRRIEDE